MDELTQASWGVIKEDRMDVEPCYPSFSTELESAEALAIALNRNFRPFIPMDHAMAMSECPKPD